MQSLEVKHIPWRELNTLRKYSRIECVNPYSEARNKGTPSLLNLENIEILSKTWDYLEIVIWRIKGKINIDVKRTMNNEQWTQLEPKLF